MPDSFFDRIVKDKTLHTPDVLACLSNLSNDEVFTPPEVVNQMLDMLPQELFQSPDTTFLDPACKTGVFLREIAKRLLVGLEDKIPDLKERIEHIFKKQLFGIAITELTSLLSRRSLYCSKYPNGPYSVCKFDSAEGNVRYRRMKHTWGKDKKCIYCGTSQEGELGEDARGEFLETHAYEWIHTVKPEEIWNMKFDVILSNPPYQLSDGGNGASASPIYHMFVRQAKALNPDYLTMIIPARWYSGGKGLDSFREEMLNDSHISRIVDYTNSADCFPGVDVAGGICYFLRNKHYQGDCLFTNYCNGERRDIQKKLNEYQTLIRYPIAEEIIKKVKSRNEANLSTYVSSRKPFGLSTDIRPEAKGDLNLRNKDGIGKYPSSKVNVGKNNIGKWKVMISRLSAEHAGQPDKNGQFRVISTMEILPPNTICTETYLIAGYFSSESEAKSYYSYLKSKFARFLVAQIAMTQQIQKTVFSFVPVQSWDRNWTDSELFAKYELTEEEIAFIETMIKPFDVNGGDN